VIRAASARVRRQTMELSLIYEDSCDSSHRFFGAARVKKGVRGLTFQENRLAAVGPYYLR
jgi:hypothetical protein